MKTILTDNLATDYLMELKKETQEISAQLEASRTDTYCLRAVQKSVLFVQETIISLIFCRTYEDILEMNLNSSKNANATIDDEHKFRVVRVFK